MNNTNQLENKYFKSLRHQLHFRKSDVVFCTDLPSSIINNIENKNYSYSLKTALKLAKFYEQPLIKMLRFTHYANVESKSPAYKALLLVQDKGLKLLKDSTIKNVIYSKQQNSDRITRSSNRILMKKFNIRPQYFKVEYSHKNPKPVLKYSLHNYFSRVYQHCFIDNKELCKSIGLPYKHFLAIKDNFCLKSTKEHISDLIEQNLSHKIYIYFNYPMPLAHTLYKNSQRYYNYHFNYSEINHGVAMAHAEECLRKTRKIIKDIFKTKPYIYLKHFNDFLTFLLKHTNSSIKSFAICLGTDPSTIKELTTNERQPRINLLYKMHSVFGLPLIIALRFGSLYHHLELGSPTYLVLKAILHEHIPEKKLDHMAGHDTHRYFRQKETDKISIHRAKRLTDALHVPKDYFDSVASEKVGNHFDFDLFLKKYPYIKPNSFAYRLKKTMCKHKLNNSALGRIIGTSGTQISELVLGKIKTTTKLPKLMKVFPKEANYISEPQRKYEQKIKLTHSPKYQHQHVMKFLKKTHNGRDVSKGEFFNTLKKIHNLGERSLAKQSGISFSASHKLGQNKFGLIPTMAYRLAKFYKLPTIYFLWHTKNYQNLEQDSPAYDVLIFKMSHHMNDPKIRHTLGSGIYQKLMKLIHKDDQVPKKLQSTLNYVKKHE